MPDLKSYFYNNLGCYYRRINDYPTSIRQF